MLDPHREIQALVDNFVADLSELAKRIAITQLQTAFGELSAPRTPRSRGRAAPPAAARVVRRGRARRDDGELEELRDKLLAAVADRPGRRTEELNEALGTTTPQIAQLLRSLVAEQRIRTEGARRGTRYFLAAEAPIARRGNEPGADEQAQLRTA